LEYLSQQFAYLEIVTVLPEDHELRDFVINRALDVRSASMIYLAFRIRHDATRLAISSTTPQDVTYASLGKVVKTIVLGDVEILDSKAYLQNCVESYHRVISQVVGNRMIIRVGEMVKGTCSSLECEFDRQQGWLH